MKKMKLSIAVCGGAGSGKTSFIRRMEDGAFLSGKSKGSIEKGVQVELYTNEGKLIVTLNEFPHLDEDAVLYLWDSSTQTEEDLVKALKNLRGVYGKKPLYLAISKSDYAAPVEALTFARSMMNQGLADRAAALSSKSCLNVPGVVVTLARIVLKNPDLTLVDAIPSSDDEE